MGKGKKLVPKNKVSWVQLIGVSASPGAREIRRLTAPATNITTNAGGAAYGRILSSAAISATEWASYAARYTEARVLAMRFHVVSGAGAAITGDRIVVSTDRSGILAVPTSEQAVWAQTAPKIFIDAMVVPGVYEARAIDIEDQLFDAVTTMTNRFGIQYAAFGTASTTIFALLPEYMVEFRGPQ